MKIHNNFHISLLRLTFIDSLTNQIQSSSSSIIVDEEKKYEINDVLNNRYHYNKLQYKISWTEHSSNEIWYSAENFEHSKEIMIDYHIRYSDKSESKLRLIHVINVIIWINETSILSKEELIRVRRWIQQTKKMTEDILNKMQTNHSYENQKKKRTFFLEKKFLCWLINSIEVNDLINR
jgi:hypothetical protein